MNFNSLWFSLGPLLAFNVLLLCTVLVYRPIYARTARLKEVENRHASKLLNRWMREYWLWLTDPFVRLFSKYEISPNTLTVIGVLISAISGFFFWKGFFGLGGWFMIFSATFDIFDGRVARATGKVTKSGAYFDSVMDRVSEGLIFLGLAVYYRDHWALWAVIAALVGSGMVSYAKARGEAHGVDYAGGSMQRPERIVYLGVGAIFSPVFSAAAAALFPASIGFTSAAQIYLVPLVFVAVMTWITTLDRTRTVMARLDGRT